MLFLFIGGQMVFEKFVRLLGDVIENSRVRDEKYRRYAKRFGLLMGSLIFAVGLFELLLRFGSALFPSPLDELIWEARQTRHNVGRTVKQVAIPLPPVSNVDVLVVGDSFPFGFNVRASETFPALIEESTGRAVVNLSVIGTSPVQYNRMMEVGFRYKPKVVVYCLFANDFVTGDAAEFSLARSEGRAPMGLLSDEDLFVESLSSDLKRDLFFRRLQHGSVLWELSQWLRHPVQSRKRLDYLDEHRRMVLVGGSFWRRRLDWDMRGVAEGVRSTIDVVAAASNLAKAHDVEFRVVLIPSKEMVYGPLLADDKGLEIGYGSHLRTYREAALMLEAEAVEVIDLTESLQRAARDGYRLYFTFDAHFDASGHRWVAEELGEKLGFSSDRD